MKTFIFVLTPTPKPRMTDRDRGKHYHYLGMRPCVAKYFKYKQDLQYLALINKFKIQDFNMFISFEFKAKNDKLLLLPHQKTPDIDNLLKGFFDAFSDNDETIYNVFAEKKWSTQDCIKVIIYDKVTFE